MLTIQRRPISRSSEPPAFAGRGRPFVGPRPAAAAGAAPATAPAGWALERMRVRRRAAGRPLPGSVRREMERAFAADFSRVRRVEGEHVADFGALALARGEEVHVDPRAPGPATAAGREILAHELAHVLQQRRGRVRPRAIRPTAPAAASTPPNPPRTTPRPPSPAAASAASATPGCRTRPRARS